MLPLLFCDGGFFICLVLVLLAALLLGILLLEVESIRYIGLLKKADAKTWQKLSRIEKLCQVFVKSASRLGRAAVQKEEKQSREFF